MSKKNIYRSQMEKLGLNDVQYSQLTDIPLKLLRKLLRNEKVSDNMSLNDFFRKNVSKIHQELENNNIETVSKAIEIKMNDQKYETNLLDWYNNEFNKETFLKKYDCKKENNLFFMLPIKVKPRYNKNGRLTNSQEISRTTYVRLINKKPISQNFLLSLLPQLYEYYTKENIDEIEFDKVAYKEYKRMETENKYTRWWANFNIEEWLIENDIPVKKFTEEAHIGHASYYYIINNKVKPSSQTLKKIKDYVERKENEKMGKEQSELQLWFGNFDLKKFTQDNNITMLDLAKELSLSASTTFALVGKKEYYKPSESVLERVKNFVDNYKKETIEVLDLEETQEIEPLESFQIGNTIVTPMENGMGFTSANNGENAIINGLKELIKERLTEQEKALIKLFGGDI